MFEMVLAALLGGLVVTALALMWCIDRNLSDQQRILRECKDICDGMIKRLERRP